MDPTNRCNQKCIWCIWGNTGAGSLGNLSTLSQEFMTGMINVLDRWGVKGLCIAGGGEPMMNKTKLMQAIHDADYEDMEFSMVTNGNYHLDDEDIKLLAQFRWIGFSVDAGDDKDFTAVHGVRGFGQVLNNIITIAHESKRNRTNCDIGFKFLIHEKNYRGIYRAVEIAKSHGVRHFHCRPLHRPDRYPDYVIEKSLELLDRARADFEDESFSVFGIQHKFTNSWEKSLPFTKCYVTPLTAVIMADQSLGLCCDRRDSRRLNLGKLKSPEDIITIWGSERHKELVDNIDVSECPRCVYTYYNELVERAFLRDDTCRSFV